MTPPQVIHVVSGLAIDTSGLILLGKRPPGKARGELWEMPGGKVDPGETLQGAMIREWKEEIGADITPGPYLGLRALELDAIFVLHLFVVFPPDIFAQRFMGLPDPIVHTELRWVDHRHAMEEYPCSPGYYLQWPLIRDFFYTHGG